MYPHERSLVQRMSNRPFALIGVNSDKSKKVVNEARERENITWRSFWNGGSTRGPISTQYGVKGWPTIYVLDHNGVIRAKGVRGEAMDEVVDQLVAEAEAAGMTGGSEPTAELREFIDATGKFKTLATFIKFEGGKVYLELEDGRSVEMSMKQLSEDDQDYVREQIRKQRR
jgi:hypothetical protein